MGKGFLLIGAIDEPPRSSVLERVVAEFYAQAQKRDRLMFIAAHYEPFREPDAELYLGKDQVPLMERLRTHGGTVVSGKRELGPKIVAFDDPLVAIVPTRRKSLWGLKDYFGRIAGVSTVAVIPAPLLDIADYEAVASGMLSDLLTKQGQSQLTVFFGEAIRQACTQFLQDFKNVHEHPNKGALRKILQEERQRLKIYFPSDHCFNESLDFAITTHDYATAKRLINNELYELPKRKR